MTGDSGEDKQRELMSIVIDGVRYVPENQIRKMSKGVRYIPASHVTEQQRARAFPSVVSSV